MPEVKRFYSFGASVCLALLAVTAHGPAGAAAARGAAPGTENGAKSDRGTRLPHARFSLATASLARALQDDLTGFRREFARTATSLALRTSRKLGVRRLAAARARAASDRTAVRGNSAREADATVRWIAHARFRRPRLGRPLHPAAQATVDSAVRGPGGSQTHAAALSIGQRIAASALAAVGDPYVWGGNSPQTGFDCSGLVQYVLAKVGVAAPRTSFAQYRFGVAVPVGALQPGDLLFFSTYAAGASHVGVYVGAGRFVDAQNSSTGVVVSTLGDPYFSSRLLGARRPWSAQSSAGA